MSPTQVDQSSRDLKDRKWWKLQGEKGLFCSEIDPVPSDVIGLVGGGGAGLEVNYRHPRGHRFIIFKLVSASLQWGVTFMMGGPAPPTGLLPRCISHIHEEGEQQGDGWNPGLFSSGARRTSMTPLTTN